MYSFLLICAFLVTIQCYTISAIDYEGHALLKVHLHHLANHTRSIRALPEHHVNINDKSIPLPSDFNPLWEGREDDGMRFIVGHVKPEHKHRFKRDSSFKWISNDLKGWINRSRSRLAGFTAGFRTSESKTVSPIASSSNNAEYQAIASYPYAFPSIFADDLTMQNYSNAYSSALINPSHSNPLESLEHPTLAMPRAVALAARSPKKPVFSSQPAEEAVYSSFVPNFRLDIYHPLDELYSYFEQLARSQHIRLFSIGHSFEGRPIYAMEGRQDPHSQKLIYLDALIHAREWITTATLLNVLEHILVQRLPVNFLVVPVINPDGYTYTWTTDRLWRKNRRPSRLRAILRSEKCAGVDLNRNFDINFAGEGASTFACSQLFGGDRPFSEPETDALRRLIDARKNEIRLFVSMHSFNQLWAAPYAYTRSPCPHADAHAHVLGEIQRAVKSVHEVHYDIGPLGRALYIGSGFSLDWAYEKAGIMHSYLVELRDKGEYGFLLPESQIMPVARETIAGILAAIKLTYHRA